MKRISVLIIMVVLFQRINSQMEVKILDKTFRVKGDLQFKYDFNGRLTTPTHHDYYLHMGTDTLTYTHLVKRKGEDLYSLIQIEKVARVDIDWSQKMIWEQSLGYGVTCNQVVLALSSGKLLYRYYYNDSKVEEVTTDKMMGINWSTKEEATQWFDKTKVIR